MYASKERVVVRANTLLPHRPKMITYRSGKVVDKLSLRWKKFPELIQQNCVTVRDLVRGIQQRLQQILEKPDSQRDEVELKYVVNFLD